jgi:hypothetical protein
MYRKNQNAKMMSGGVQHLQKDAKPAMPTVPESIPQPIQESVFRPPKEGRRKKKFQRD